MVEFDALVSIGGGRVCRQRGGWWTFARLGEGSRRRFAVFFVQGGPFHPYILDIEGVIDLMGEWGALR